mmetsp:Transcript_16303/g.34437  ORF Transcript_16303/g.34437 Transcript_16303/m.34437 type:complete len:229 (-) Transcript_16303:98-784(-)
MHRHRIVPRRRRTQGRSGIETKSHRASIRRREISRPPTPGLPVLLRKSRGRVEHRFDILHHDGLRSIHVFQRIRIRKGGIRRTTSVRFGIGRSPRPERRIALHHPRGNRIRGIGNAKGGTTEGGTAARRGIRDVELESGTDDEDGEGADGTVSEEVGGVRESASFSGGDRLGCGGYAHSQLGWVCVCGMCESEVCGYMQCRRLGVYHKYKQFSCRGRDIPPINSLVER